MLKSYNKSQDAIIAIPNVAGGFKLTKFHSNDRKTLATIPDGDKQIYCIIIYFRPLKCNQCGYDIDIILQVV